MSIIIDVVIDNYNFPKFHNRATCSGSTDVEALRVPSTVSTISHEQKVKICKNKNYATFFAHELIKTVKLKHLGI